MKHKLYMSPAWLKESFKIAFFKLHYVAGYGLLATVLAFGVVTAGPALLALNTVLRPLAEGQKPEKGCFWRAFRGKFRQGLPLSLLLCLMLLGLLFPWTELGSAIVGRLGSLLLMFLCLFYPAASHGQSHWGPTLRNAVVYSLAHMLQTFFLLGCGYLLYALAGRFFPVWGLLVLPYLLLGCNRIVLANNREIDNRENQNSISHVALDKKPHR